MLAGTTCESTTWNADSAVVCKRASFGVGLATAGFAITTKGSEPRYLTELFSFDEPQASGIQSYTSTYDRGTSGLVSVTLQGQTFSSDRTISARIGGTSCEATEWISSSSIFCKLPRTSCRVEGTVVTAAVVLGTHSSAFTYDPPPIVALAAGGKQGQGKCVTCIVFDLRHMKCWVSIYKYTHARAFEPIALAQSRPPRHLHLTRTRSATACNFASLSYRDTIQQDSWARIPQPSMEEILVQWETICL